jgi:hypothetical protein
MVLKIILGEDEWSKLGTGKSKIFQFYKNSKIDLSERDSITEIFG